MAGTGACEELPAERATPLEDGATDEDLGKLSGLDGGNTGASSSSLDSSSSRNIHRTKA